jgi:hypothetical protein
MPTFYARLALGSTKTTEGTTSFSGVADTMSVEADNRVQAFLQVYRNLREEYSDITALKAEGQDFILGFTAEEWDTVAQQPIRLRVVQYPDGDAQIQAIQTEPFE